ncbi:LysR family transcriptional regulator [Pseudomonas baltica]|uniref:LysR family transcriptional regulator n=1 Tax=Pseudomonas baltica TaxID=2762576 RepID=UPI00289D6A4F|nr:LysR family transcriptional regulator [Pseudomonas baltica]
MKTPDLNLLVSLHCLIEECSVAGAARRMNLSAPAMSRTLARIREAMEDPILVRSQRGMIPTPKALQIQEQVRGIVELAQGFFVQSQGFDLRTMSRTFSIRANDVFVGAYGVKLVAILKEQAPNSVLRFVAESDLEVDPLNAGSIDLVIGSSRKFGADIKVQNLFSCPFVGIARTHHPIFDEEITPERFASFDHISVSRRGRSQGPIDVALAELSLTRRVSYIIPTFHAALFAVADSDLLLPVPVPMLEKISHLGLNLRTFTLPIPTTSVMIVQAWHPRLEHDEAHRWLRRTLKVMTAD